MALNINTNLTNNLDGYLVDAKNVKGTYVVVNNYSDLANLPSACVVNGTLAYCQSDYSTHEAGFYQYTGNGWEVADLGGGGGVATLMTSVTYSQFVSAISGGTLIAGMVYRITDYVTKIHAVYDLSMVGQTGAYLPYATSAEHPFDLLVTATGTNTYNENVKAMLHTGDTYFANSNLTAWELKWTHLNDTTKYSWADSTNGKGIITWMKDEFGNEAWYDFKNVMYLQLGMKRKDTTSITGKYFEYNEAVPVYDNLITSEFLSESAYIGYYVNYNEELVEVTNSNYQSLDIVPGTTTPYTKQINRYGTLFDVFSTLLGEDLNTYVTIPYHFLTTTSDYVGYYITNGGSNVYQLVTNENCDSLGIEPRSTAAYIDTTNLKFDVQDIQGTSAINLLVFINDVSKETLDSTMDWTYMLMGLSAAFGMTIDLNTLAYLLGVPVEYLQSLTERQVIRLFFNGDFYYTFDFVDHKAGDVHKDLSFYGDKCQENKFEHCSDILTTYLNNPLIPIIPNGLNCITFENNNYCDYLEQAELVCVSTDNKFSSNDYLMVFGCNCFGNSFGTNNYNIRCGNICYNNKFTGFNSDCSLGYECYDNIINQSNDLTFTYQVRHNEIEGCDYIYLYSNTELYQASTNNIISFCGNLSIYGGHNNMYGCSLIKGTCFDNHFKNFSVAMGYFGNDEIFSSSTLYTNSMSHCSIFGSSVLKFDGNNISYNTIKNSNGITTSNQFSYNNIERGRELTFGTNCYYNIIANSNKVTFGNTCYKNKIYNCEVSDSAESNITFGNSCYSNIIDSSAYITFNNNCNSNTINQGCSTIELNSYSSDITIMGYCLNIRIGFTETTGYSGGLYGAIIEQNVQNLRINFANQLQQGVLWTNGLTIKQNSGTVNSSEPKIIVLPTNVAGSFTYSSNNNEYYI